MAEEVAFHYLYHRITGFNGTYQSLVLGVDPILATPVWGRSTPSRAQFGVPVIAGNKQTLVSGKSAQTMIS